jgi:molybdopterin synthase sulfur carrier subunit
MSMLTVRYFAGARAAAGGIRTEHIAAASMDELTRALTERHGERLAIVLKAASYLVDGLACHDGQAALPEGATVDVLPPFAGG